MLPAVVVVSAGSGMGTSVVGRIFDGSALVLVFQSDLVAVVVVVDPPPGPPIRIRQGASDSKVAAVVYSQLDFEWVSPAFERAHNRAP